MTTFIRAKEAAKRSGMHVVTVRRKANDPTDPFPAFVDLSENVKALVEVEYEQWAKSCIAERDGKDME